MKKTITIKECYDLFQKYGNLGIKVNTPYGYKNINGCDITEIYGNYINIELEDGKFIEGSVNHKIKLSDGEFIELKNITEGCKVQTIDGDKKVISIINYGLNEDLYDIEVNEVRQYYANGIVSHNSVLSVDLPLFLFFNTTTKTVKAEEIFNRFTEKDKVYVKGEINIDGEDYILVRQITRKQSKSGEWNVKTELDFFKKLPNGELQNFTGEQRRETENFIKNSIGNIDDFLMTILTTASNLEDLIDSKPTARGQVLSRFLGLEFLKKKEEAGKEIYSTFSKSMISNLYNTETLKSEIDDLQIKINDYNKEISVLESNILDCNQNLEKGKKFKEDLLLQKFNDIEHELLILNPTTVQSEIDSINNKINDIQIQISNIKIIKPKEFYDEDIHDEIKEQISTNNKQKAMVDIKIESLVKLKSEVSGGIKCQHCGIDLMNAELTVAKLAEMDSLRNESSEFANKGLELQTKEKEFVQFKKDFDEYERNKLIKEKYELSLESENLKLEKSKDKLKRYHDAQDKIQKNKLIEEKLIKANIRIDEIEREKTQFSNKISSNKTMIENCNKDIKSKNEKIFKILEEFEKEKVYKTYLEIFGKNGISKMIMRTMMPLINEELRRLLEDSALFKLEIRINDKNEVDFIMVDNSTGIEKQMSSGSGFERTIASLALRAVLSKICSLPKPNIIVFDEIFGKVSNENLDMVGEFFSKIKEYFEKIFVITHNPMVSNWANNVVKIQKVDNISKVIQ